MIVPAQRVWRQSPAPVSRWNSSGELNVGNSGSGTLNVEAGGVVSNTYGYIGSSSGSTGVATVTGSGSKWNNSNDLIVGRTATGTLNVMDGGVVSSFSSGFIGYYNDATGEATVTGAGSRWNSLFDLTVGREGSGTLNVEAGGVVANTSGDIGSRASGTGMTT